MSNIDIITDFSSALVPVSPPPSGPPPILPDGLSKDYLEFLAATNGGYTRDYLFHLFGYSGPREHDLVRWNMPETWKASFGLDEKPFVFAEDILGNQYYFHITPRRKVIKVFCIDDNSSLPIANDFPSFISNMINNREANSIMRNLFNEYLRHTRLQYPLFTHLSSKIPASLGGDDRDLENIELMNSIAHLNFTGQLTGQLKGLPPGTRIKDILFDENTLTLKIIT